jgi:hypothetical protein
VEVGEHEGELPLCAGLGAALRHLARLEVDTDNNDLAMPGRQP